jgi:prephenate dehydratase
MKTIVYQGIEGSFSHLTAKRTFGTSCRILGLPTFREAFEAVERGDADLALLPIENTLAGTIYETLDLLAQGTLKIVGVTNTRVEHSLLGIPGGSIQTIKKVLSHPKALAQCTRFIAEHPAMEAISHYDTAGSALDIAKAQDPSCAAIANSAAAQIYGLEVLARGIQDHAENFTRFFLISREAVIGKKCSLCFTLEHRSGSLAAVLAFFAEHDVNLTYIVSRPIVEKPFEYMFYVDLETQNAAFIDELRNKTNSLKVLGTYNVIP